MHLPKLTPRFVPYPLCGTEDAPIYEAGVLEDLTWCNKAK